MEDKKNNIGTDLDISIEDILADPTLGVSEEGTSGEKDPAYKLVNGFIVESTEGAERRETFSYRPRAIHKRTSYRC